MKGLGGKTLICLFEKLQIYTVLALRNTAEQFIAGVNSQQKVLREKAASGNCLWCLFS